MANVSRNSPNLLVLPAVNIYLRQYPGTDAGGAIADATFVLRAGNAAASGQSAADGLVATRIPVGQTVSLEVFGSTFDLKVRPALENVTTIEGAKRRLHMLGYQPGPVDATINLQSDLALLKFQADQAVDPIGYDNSQAVNATTRTKLTNVAGA